MHSKSLLHVYHNPQPLPFLGDLFFLLDGLMGNDKIHGNDVIGSARMGTNLGEDAEGPAPVGNVLTVQAAQRALRKGVFLAFSIRLHFFKQENFPLKLR